MFRITIVCLAALVAFPSCVSQQAHKEVLDANLQLQEERDALANHVNELSQQNRRLTSDVERLGANAAEAAWLAAEKKKLAELIDRLGSGGNVDIKGVRIRESAEGVVVEVQGEVLFASGKVELSEVGRRTLQQLAPAVLREGGRIRVEGHTDSDPIVHSPWKTNLRLSSERAHSVAEYLIGAGMPAGDVAIAGYGEHRPIAAGDTAEAKQANRRVEILLLRN